MTGPGTGVAGSALPMLAVPGATGCYHAGTPACRFVKAFTSIA
jgi:hypothetical protein